MNDDSLQILKTLQNAENIVRIGVAASFALSLFLNGYVMQRQTAGQSGTTLLRMARVCFLAGTALLIAFCTIAFISPAKSVASLANTGIALVLAVITLALDRDNPGLPALNFLSGALIFLITEVATYAFAGTGTAQAPLPWVTLLHISTAVAGEGLFVVAFCSSLLYVWDYRRLKLKIIDKNPFLPSLNTLDRTIERTSLAGLFLITTSLVTGIALTFMSSGQPGSGLIKIIWAFTVWGWYVLSIFGREFWGWRGRRGAQLSIWGTALLLVSLFGTAWTRF